MSYTKYKVVTCHVTAGGLMCYVTGLTGYLSSRDVTEGEIPDNLTGPLAAFFKVLVILPPRHVHTYRGLYSAAYICACMQFRQNNAFGMGKYV